jgi:hypothetical protein
MPAESHLRDPQNESIGKITAGNQQISPQLPIEINVFLVSNDQSSHAMASK